MVEGNYERILKRIANSSGLEKTELERKVEEKREKLSGLISREGAAQVIAAELGISFDNEKLKINELLPGMRKVNLIGKIINMSPIRTFKTKGGEESKVTNLWVADDTSNIRVVLWDIHHIEKIEKSEIGEGSVVEILNGGMRDNELHLGSFSEFKLSSEQMGEVHTEKVVNEKNISDFKRGDSVSVRAFVVQIFDPRFFNVCPECSKKVVQEEGNFVCKEHSKIVPEKRALANIVIDDGTESIRAVLFHENLSNFGLTDLEDSEKLLVQRQALIGKEMIFSGNARNNAFFNNLEFIIDNIKEVDFDELVEKLEKD